jgi:hypothetical protein
MDGSACCLHHTAAWLPRKELHPYMEQQRTVPGARSDPM